MNCKNEPQEWVSRENALTRLLNQSYAWSELIGCGENGIREELLRLEESLVYAIGTDEILETVVEQDVDPYCKIEERLRNKLQVTVFT